MSLPQLRWGVPRSGEGVSEIRGDAVFLPIAKASRFGAIAAADFLRKRALFLRVAAGFGFGKCPLSFR